MQASGKRLQPLRINRRQGQRQGHPARTRTHCRDVREIHGNGPVPQIDRIDIDRKVHTADDRVDHGNKFTPGVGLQDGAVVANTDDHAGRPVMAGEETLDQLELIHCLGTGSRSAAATARRRRDMH